MKSKEIWYSLETLVIAWGLFILIDWLIRQQFSMQLSLESGLLALLLGFFDLLFRLSKFHWSSRLLLMGVPLLLYLFLPGRPKEVIILLLLELSFSLLPISLYQFFYSYYYNEKKVFLMASFLILLSALPACTIFNAINPPPRKFSPIYCTSRLKQLGLACRQYAIDYQEFYPDRPGNAGLQQLYLLNYLSDPILLYCGSSQNDKEAARPDILYFHGWHDRPEHDSLPLLIEIPRFHDRYHNVLLCNGHIENPNLQTQTIISLISDLHQKYQYTPEQYQKLLEIATICDQTFPRQKPVVPMSFFYRQLWPDISFLCLILGMAVLYFYCRRHPETWFGKRSYGPPVVILLSILYLIYCRLC